MKNCPNCGNLCDDAVAFCNACGAPLNGNVPYQGAFDPSDHTAEFDANDISQNKVLAMIPYLMGWIGIIISLLAVNNSAYVAYHVKQALKLQVVSILSIVLCIVPILGWLAYAVCAVIVFVLTIMGFFQVCSGKAKELPILKKLAFLK
ncbi:MAG: zinc ribbon domain-containing protein [Ruminococcaceae bacterium]|nr:zinc ribbon domain-containing protein [Oscillospiraceae bacterium]